MSTTFMDDLLLGFAPSTKKLFVDRGVIHVNQCSYIRQ